MSFWTQTEPLTGAACRACSAGSFLSLPEATLAVTGATFCSSAAISKDSIASVLWQPYAKWRADDRERREESEQGSQHGSSAIVRSCLRGFTTTHGREEDMVRKGAGRSDRLQGGCNEMQ